MTFALRSRRLALSRRFVRLSLQTLSALQIMLLIELGYTGLSYAAKVDQHDIPIARASAAHTPAANIPLKRPVHERLIKIQANDRSDG